MSEPPREPEAARSIRALLLGPASIEFDGRIIPVLEWTRRAARSLLFMLLGTPGHRVSRDLAFETLWPDLEPESAANALYKTIHWLRRELEPQLAGGRSSTYLVLSADFIALAPGLEIWSDAEQFERWIMTRSNSPEARRVALRHSLQLYRGDFLADEPFLDWPAARRESLNQLWQRGVLEIAVLDREAGESDLALPLLEMLVERDPLLESAHQELILCHLASGRRDAAQRAYDRCTRLLREELDIEPDERTKSLLLAPAQVEAPVRRQLPVAPLAIVGREHELDRIETLFGDERCRLVSLTGPGGVGKTRLAIETGWQLISSFDDGTIFIPLAAVRDLAQLEFAVAAALGLRIVDHELNGERIGAAIDGRSLLLILDNAEQIIEQVASFTSGLLAASRTVRVLVTSRERLRIRGEYEVAVPPLTVPGADRSARSISSADSVVLFTNLMRMQNPDFAITTDNAATIARICARLDGLPLSLELAASRARRMRPEALLAALEDPLETLTSGARDLPDRHRSLREAIAWSYDLLTAEEQRTFRSVAVFSGGTTEEAIEYLFPGASRSFESLAEKSLAVWTDTEQEPRLSMMETVREFAEDRAIVAGEWADLQERHARWVAEGAELAGAAYYSPNQTAWARRIELELPNIRAALEWAFARGETAIASTIVANITLFMELRGYYSEGREWTRRALQMPNIEPRARIRLLHSFTFLNFRLADYAAGDVSFREAVALAEEIGAEDLLAIVLNNMSRSPWYRAQGDQTQPMLERALELHRRHNDKHGETISTKGLGTIAALRGNYELALELDLKSIELARESRIPSLYLYMIANYSVELAVGGFIEQAEPWFEEARRMAQEVQDPTIEASVLHGLGLLAGFRGDFETSLSRFRRVVDINRRTGYRQGYALGLHELGRLEWRRGNLSEAAKYLRDGIEVFITDGIDRWTIELVDSVAALLLSSGRGEIAARLVGYADQARRARNIGRMVIEAKFFEQLMNALDAEFGETERNRLMAEGTKIADDEAHRLILQTLALVESEPGDATFSNGQLRSGTPKPGDATPG
jgi:predicted ATPase/DNA-binding SARP family transcriptional activator